ncbi:MAG TPA: hypothetical protein VFZ02_04515 [Ktedonobacteraceae bacterium]
MWRSPEDLIMIGFGRSRVVMMNENHDGLLRCCRTREIGSRILPTAHQAGVRYLAMEALNLLFAEECNRTRHMPEAREGYLSQPEMRELIQSALDLEWTLISYEADMSQVPPVLANKDDMSIAVTNWREEAQARNILSALQPLPSDAMLLVWCGNSHHMKEIRHDEQMMIQRDGEWILISKLAEEPDWMPMGYQFKRMSSINPFTIHQYLLDGLSQTLSLCTPQLESFGGTAGFLKEEPPHPFLAHFAQNGGDAFVFSTQNTME